MPDLKPLIIGFGSIAKRHAANLRLLGAREILVYDVNPQRRKMAREEGSTHVVETIPDAFDQHPNVALICTPPNSHLELASEAARHGCHLFIEKPLADRREGVTSLIALIRSERLLSMVGCNLRFHPGIITVKKLLDQGTIGRIVSARAEAGQYLPDWHPTEDYRNLYTTRRDLGGGIILDAIHEIDYLQWMLGDIREVACFSGNLSHLQMETEDTAGILLRFKSGVIGEVHLDCVQRAYSRTCQLIGDEGTIRWDFGSGEVRWFTVKTGKWEVSSNPPNWQLNEMYLDEMRHFLSCLADKSKPFQDIQEASQVLEVALAAKLSSETGKVITLQ